MSNKIGVSSHISRYYQITVEGKIDASWADWLYGMQLVCWQKEEDKQMTTLSGILTDQAALRGLLTRLWDLNLSLYSVQSGDPGEITPYGITQYK